MNKMVPKSIKNIPKLSIQPLKTSSVVFTNYPEPCALCNLQQCGADLAHSLYFISIRCIDEVFDKRCKKKDPDVIGCFLVGARGFYGFQMKIVMLSTSLI